MLIFKSHECVHRYTQSDHLHSYVRLEPFAESGVSRSYKNIVQKKCYCMRPTLTMCLVASFSKKSSFHKWQITDDLFRLFKHKCAWPNPQLQIAFMFICAASTALMTSQLVISGFLLLWFYCEACAKGDKQPHLQPQFVRRAELKLKRLRTLFVRRFGVMIIGSARLPGFLHFVLTKTSGHGSYTDATQSLQIQYSVFTYTFQTAVHRTRKFDHVRDV